jgi:CBS domain containing-hemolysin-like protein
MAEAMHTRLPVYSDSIDSIVGVAHIKDLVRALDEGRGEDVVEDIQRPVLLLPETMKVHDLLRMFQARRISMAVVVDEYGGTSGIVTMEDLIEEIVGEIQDEHETEEAWIVPESDGVLSVDGRADLDEIAEVAGTPLDFDEVETVGGLLFSRMGYLPRVGEWLDLEGLRFHVLEADEKRIYRVRIERSPEGESGQESGEADGDGGQDSDRS